MTVRDDMDATIGNRVPDHYADDAHGGMVVVTFLLACIIVGVLGFGWWVLR